MKERERGEESAETRERPRGMRSQRDRAKPKAGQKSIVTQVIHADHSTSRLWHEVSSYHESMSFQARRQFEPHTHLFEIHVYPMAMQLQNFNANA